MSNFVITFSPTGGTKRVAKILADSLGCDSFIDLTKRNGDFASYSFTADDFCIVAVPSYGGRVPQIAAERLRCMKGNGAKAVVVAVFGNRAIEDTLVELLDVLSEASFTCIAAMEAVAEHSIVREVAAGRPDADDVVDLQNAAKQIAAVLAEGKSTAPEVPGNRPYKDLGVIPLKPIAGAGCVACGICAMACPVGAIDIIDASKTDADACINCMSCVSACSYSARVVNEDTYNMLAAKLKSLCADRKPVKLYL